MKVFTFFTPTEINPIDEVMLLLQWAESWANAGFEPIVLNEFHASRQGKVYEAYCKAIEAFPSTNPKGYDRACFMRWLACAVNPFTKPAESFLMTDYDVMAYASKPFTEHSKGKKLVFFQKHVPCCVLGNKQAFMSQCARFMEYVPRETDLVNTSPHVSDQTVIARMFEEQPDLAVNLHVVKGYQESGWHNAPAVHFCNASMIPAGKIPRHKFVKHLRSEGVLLRDKTQAMSTLTKTFIHITEQHAEDPIPYRKTISRESWKVLAAYQGFRTELYREGDYRRVGFERKLPYLKDLLEFGLSQSQPEDIIILTNDDTILHTALLSYIETHLKKMPFGCAFRVDIGEDQYLTSITQPLPQPMPWPNNIGHDLYFFQSGFLRGHMQDIPDFVLGTWKWDLILACLMREWAGVRVDYQTIHANSTVELPFGCVAHIRHNVYWSHPENIKSVPSQIYNYNLYLEWIKQHAPTLLTSLP